MDPLPRDWRWLESARKTDQESFSPGAKGGPNCPFTPSSCPCLIAVSVTLRRGVLQGWGFNLQLGAGGFGCQIVTAQCVPSHKARPQGLGPP